jgi:uncharacterized protein (UPF0332 family)
MLLEAADYNSAISRAYYAMFDLARDELLRINPKLVKTKTHATIIRRFSKFLIEERGLPRELGQDLRRVFEARIGTEYSQVVAAAEEAKAAVEAMERFLEAFSQADEEHRSVGNKP